MPFHAVVFLFLGYEFLFEYILEHCDLLQKHNSVESVHTLHMLRKIIVCNSISYGFFPSSET